ncbi:MAG: N-acetylglucosamine-6-phosphate deacetylase [Clostridia bacterium]|nr:N-acetylglucosamine-6-phosphate deacetylase [Clostridia bacterium]
MKIYNAKVYDTENRRFFDGAVSFDDGIITKISREKSGDIDARGAYLLPGLIDVHSHGRGGCDFMNAAPERISECFGLYLKHGVTTVFPCVMTAPYGDILKAIDNIKNTKTDINVDGIHVEGPYVSPKRPGCHTVSQLRPLYADEACELTRRISPKKAHFTVAPELEGADAFIKTLVDNGATVGIGHTDCTYGEAMRALGLGCVSFTHTFNAMRELKHREPGTVGAALSGAAYAEFICDLFHVSAPVIDLAYRAIGCGRFVIVSDSIAAADMEDGVYYLSGMRVNVKDGRARNDDGAIAGSTTNIFDELKNLYKTTDAPFEDVVLTATANPAKQVGIYGHTGSIAVGKRADMILTDKENVLLTVSGGKMIQI